MLPCFQCKRRRLQRQIPAPPLALVDKGLPSTGVCFYCCQEGHFAGSCPQLSATAVLAFRAISAADWSAYQQHRPFIKDVGEDLSPLDHVYHGNVVVQSRWFSCSRASVEPAYFWSTCQVVDAKCRHTRGHNWSTQRIALIDLAQCSVRADVSTPALAWEHGVTRRPQLELAVSNKEVILREVPHQAVLRVHSVESICRGLCPGHLIDEADNRAAVDRWRHYAEWAARRTHPGAPRPRWLPA